MKFLSVLLLAAITGSSALVNPHHGHHVREASLGHSGSHGQLVNRQESHLNLKRSVAIHQRRQARQKRCVERQGLAPTPSSSSSVVVESSSEAPVVLPTDTPVAVENVVVAPAPAPPAPAPVPAPAPPAEVIPPPPPPPPSTPAPPTSEARTGQATFYDPGLGACGFTNGPGDFIVAVSRQLYDGFEGFTGGNPNNNPICGRKIRATANGKSIEVTVVDRCEACAPGDLDFTPTGFQQLADLGVGRLNGLSWVFI